MVVASTERRSSPSRLLTWRAYCIMARDSAADTSTSRGAAQSLSISSSAIRILGFIGKTLGTNEWDVSFAPTVYNSLPRSPCTFCPDGQNFSVESFIIPQLLEQV